MPLVSLRHNVRAVILDGEDRILLCRFELPTRVVWATPGGGVEPDETPLGALRRELLEETGLVLATTPPLVWQRRVVEPGYVRGYDGTTEEYFLVRTAAFEPDGALSREELAAENVTGFRWWQLAEILNHRGPELFGPRDLAGPLAMLIKDGVPGRPLKLGL